MTDRTICQDKTKASFFTRQDTVFKFADETYFSEFTHADGEKFRSLGAEVSGQIQERPFHSRVLRSGRVTPIIDESQVVDKKISSQSAGDLSERISLHERRPREREPVDCAIEGPKDAALPQARKREGTALSRVRRGAPVGKSDNENMLFSGLFFYFIPNSRVNAARAARMKKVEVMGGTILSLFDKSKVTHVIVDRDITASVVLKHVGLKLLPAGVSVYNEHWTPDCVIYAKLIEAMPRYQVEGHEYFVKELDENSIHTIGDDIQEEEEHSLEKSLQIRPAKSRTAHVPHDTLSHDESLAIASLSPTVAFQRTVVEESPVPTSSARPADELDTAFRAISRLGSVRFEDEEEYVPASVDTDSTSTKEWDRSFKCMQAHVAGSTSAVGPNDFVIDKLRVMQEYYESSRDPADKWKPRGYRLAIAALKKEQKPIDTFDKAIRVPSVGERLANHIVEIVRTGTMNRIDNLGESYAIVQQFMQVYGIGPVQANEFVSKGYNTLESLANSGLLSENQKLGIALYDDLNSRIPREEVYQHKQVVSREANKVDLALQVYLMGSFRRGAKDCGDIDIMITRKDTPIVELIRKWQILLQVLLQERAYLTHTLVSSDHRTGLKWQGISRLGDAGMLYRRIDFIIVPWEQRGAALLYFTGSDLFNRSMRLLARKKGYRLNEKGLWKNPMRGRGLVKITDGENTGAETEQDIFQILRVPFRRPEERCISA